jgi:hypothetical protein
VEHEILEASGGGIQPKPELFPSSTVFVDGVIGSIGGLRASEVQISSFVGCLTSAPPSSSQQ